jgi:DNA repair protein RecO (recombination protein O)
MAYSELNLMEQQGRYVLTEANTIELFTELQGDIELLSLSSYFLQVTETAAQEEDPEPELLSLLLNVLYALGKLRKPQALVKAVFELRLCVLVGFLPDLEGCADCGDREVKYFHIMDGQLYCPTCGQSHSDGIRMPVSRGTVDAMHYIVNCDTKKLFSFQMGPSSAEQLYQLAETYLTTQLERGFSTLDFYKSLLITI